VFALPDGPRILDCIEFDDDLRFVDVVDDVAFLAMDLERLGAPDLARTFLRSYATGAGVELPHTLLELSTAYRAQVRKTACLRAAQHDVGSPEHQDAAASARLLLEICVRHLEAGRVRLVVVGGLPGTGKSTLAAALGAELDAAVLRSDVTRKARAGLAPDDHADAPYRSGLYASDTTDAVYRDLLDQARPLLRAGRSVVLDASFADERHRARSRSLAATTSSAITELRCVLPDESAAVRMQARRAGGHDASDATPEIAQAMASAFDPWPQAVPVPRAVARGGPPRPRRGGPGPTGRAGPDRPELTTNLGRLAAPLAGPAQLRDLSTAVAHRPRGEVAEGRRPPRERSARVTIGMRAARSSSSTTSRRVTFATERMARSHHSFS
jgi:hypothetical protein